MYCSFVNKIFTNLSFVISKFSKGTRLSPTILKQVRKVNPNDLAFEIIMDGELASQHSDSSTMA